MRLPPCPEPRTQPTGGLLSPRHVDEAEVGLPGPRPLIIPPCHRQWLSSNPSYPAISLPELTLAPHSPAPRSDSLSVSSQLWRSVSPKAWWLLFWSSTSSSTSSPLLSLGRCSTRASMAASASVGSHHDDFFLLLWCMFEVVVGDWA